MGRTRESMLGHRYALKHGHTWKDEAGRPHVSPTYKSWQAMKNRCRPGQKYGRLGITVCDRWLESFENFLEDMGERPGLDYSIDRDDPYGNYEPGKCHWRTRSQQQRNRRHRDHWPNQYG